MSRKAVKQSKKTARTLQRLGYRTPYQIVVDDEFLMRFNTSMLRFKRLSDLFWGQPKLFITKCVYRKFKEAKRPFRSDLSGYCKILRCKYTEPETPECCIARMVKESNKNHYILACGRPEIRNRYKSCANVPVLTCQNGQLRLFADTSRTLPNHRLRMEAGEDELERLEKMFGNPQEQQ
jgi:U3 small nucleolar RNA-associated protein 23